MDVCAYSVMPGHVHALVHSVSADVSTLVRRWKQTTGYQWKRAGNPHPLWQRGYYDRVLRLDEDPRAVAAYIVMNPVRAGLVPRPEDHALTGAPGIHLALPL